MGKERESLCEEEEREAGAGSLCIPTRANQVVVEESGMQMQ
jgi:hypothetical protein